MKKVVRLTESDLVRLINKVINEEEEIVVNEPSTSKETSSKFSLNNLATYDSACDAKITTNLNENKFNFKMSSFTGKGYFELYTLISNRVFYTSGPIDFSKSYSVKVPKSVINNGNRLFNGKFVILFYKDEEKQSNKKEENHCFCGKIVDFGLSKNK